MLRLQEHSKLFQLKHLKTLHFAVFNNSDDENIIPVWSELFTVSSYVRSVKKLKEHNI